MAPRDRAWRIVGEAVVVAVVAEGGRALRKVAEIGFIPLVEKSILRGQAFGKRLLFLGKNRCGGADQKQEG